MKKPGLTKKLKLREIELPNRIVLSPMQMYKASKHGQMTDWHLVHYGKYAYAKFGLIFTEVLCVEKRGRSTYSDAGIWNNSHTSGNSRKLPHIFAHKEAFQLLKLDIAAQNPQDKDLTMDYSLSKTFEIKNEPGWQIVSCSSIPAAPGYDTPTALSTSGVKSLVKKFGLAAKRCDEAGFDVLDVHAAHGYLIHSFLSPLSNFRTDEYGGSQENRNRFAIEIAIEIRKFWPANKPLFFRLSCIDRFPGGLEIEDTISLSKALKKVGVDLIDCSSGGIKGPNSLFSLAAKEVPKPGFQVGFSEAIKQNANIATMAVGMISEPRHANDIIEQKKADLIALGREALVNPHWPLYAMRDLSKDKNFNDWPPNSGWWLEVRQRMLNSSDPNDWKVGPAAGNTPK